MYKKGYTVLGHIYRTVEGASSQHDLCYGTIHLAGFGRNYLNEENINWTFKNLSKAEDAQKDSPLTRYLPEIAQQLGVKKILVPSPVKFNGKMVDHLREEIHLRDEVVVYRDKDSPADGILLKPGEAFAISAAGCAVIVGWRVDPKTRRVVRMGVAHAGLISILNDVGGSLALALGGPVHNLCFSIEFAISDKILKYPLDHPNPEWRRSNQELLDFIAANWGAEALPGSYEKDKYREGHVSTLAMIRQQLMGLGVPGSNVMAGAEIGLDDNYYTTSKDDNMRNLFIVAYY